VVNIKELWIGEDVEILSSGRIGRFEGVSNDGRARVSSNDKVYLVTASNLKVYEEPKVDKVKELMQEMNQRSDSCKLGSMNDEIDLHIKKLNPSLANGRAEHILNHQLAACRSFVTEAIKGYSRQRCRCLALRSPSTLEAV